jgi:hypothetical protein
VQDQEARRQSAHPPLRAHRRPWIRLRVLRLQGMGDRPGADAVSMPGELFQGVGSQGHYHVLPFTVIWMCHFCYASETRWAAALRMMENEQ